MVGLAYVGVAAIVAGATVGGWWSVRAHEAHAQRQSSAQRGDAIAAALRDQVAAKGKADDFGAVRALLADLAASQSLSAARVTLGDGTVVADGREAASIISKIPERWPSTASTVSDGPIRRAVVDVPGKGPLVIEINAGEPTGAMTDLEFFILVGGAAVVVATLAIGLAARRRTRSLAEVGDALAALASGETDLGALHIRETGTGSGDAWNRLLNELATLRIRRRVEDASERRTVANAAPATDDIVPRVADSLWIGLLGLEADMRIRYCNGAAGIFLGSTRDKLIGRPISECFVDPAAAAELAKVGDGRARQVFETRIGDGDGATVLRVSSRGLSSGGAMLVLEDVTQQRIADRSRNAFVEQATHELRTPLTNIRLCMEELLDAPDIEPAKRAQHLNVVNQEVRRLERIVGDMLSISEIEAGTLQLAPDDVRLAPMFEEIQTDFTTQAKNKNLRLTFAMPPKLPTMVGDRDKLTIAITNVLGNAIKYTPEGGDVTVSVRADDRELIVQIADTGIGMSPEDAAKVFERFYRAKDPRVSKITGTGLGLALARDVVKLHGGDIGVESVRDKGSTFTIRVPLGAPLRHAA
jgi:signal transduction histidine kinase